MLRVLTLTLLVGACQYQGQRRWNRGPAPASIAEVRQSLGMTVSDEITRSHRIVVIGQYTSEEGQGVFQRSYEPDGSFESRTEPEGGTAQVSRFDGTTLWVESNNSSSYPLTPAHAHLASSIEWVLGARWLQGLDSPFDTQFIRERNPGEGAQIKLNLNRNQQDKQSLVRLDPVTLQPAELRLEGRKGEIVLRLSSWQTRRGFPWPYHIELQSADGSITQLQTTEVRFEPSLRVAESMRPKWIANPDTEFLVDAGADVPLRQTRSGHWLVKPKLMGKTVGWFLVDTGTGVNCLDEQLIGRLPSFLRQPDYGETKISIVGLGGQVPGSLMHGGEFQLGPLVANRMEWVALDLSNLEEVVGARLAGVVGGELFRRAVIEIDALERRMRLYNPRDFDRPQLDWFPLRFDGSTPCIQGEFSPGHEGWFRFDTGSDDTVTFHAPWVQKLGMMRQISHTIRMRLRGIGGEISAQQGRIGWFETLGHRHGSPRVTLVEHATGPLANPDLMGNIGVGFFEGHRLILDYPHHQITSIPR